MATGRPWTADGRGHGREVAEDLRPEGPAWEGEGPSLQCCGESLLPRWALKPAHCPTRRLHPGCPAVPPHPRSSVALQQPGEATWHSGCSERASLPSSPGLGVQGPTLPGGPGPCPRPPCEQDPSPELCLWKESWFPRKLPGNKRHAYIFQNKLIKGLRTLLFYFWQKRQSRNQGPALSDLMFAELGCCARGVPSSPPGLPPGPEQPLTQQGWHQPAPSCPVQGPARHTSHAFGCKWPLRDSPGHSRSLPVPSQFSPSSLPVLSKSEMPPGHLSALSPGPAEGGPAPPVRKAWVPFPLRATRTPRSRAGFLHAPRAPFLLLWPRGLPRGPAQAHLAGLRS